MGTRITAYTLALKMDNEEKVEYGVCQMAFSATEKKSREGVRWVDNKALSTGLSAEVTRPEEGERRVGGA